MFKLTADDKAQWKWMGEQRPQPCDVCRYRTYSRAHLIARSQGGRVLDNIVWLCEDRFRRAGLHIGGCHPWQEKRTEAFMAEVLLDLFAIAAAHTAQWRKETTHYGS